MPSRRAPDAKSVRARSARWRSAAPVPIALLKRNLTPAGILAATATAARRKARLHGHLRPRRRRVRDRHGALRRSAARARSRHGPAHARRTPGAERADPEVRRRGRSREADFWYLGCIDSTLWWLIAHRVSRCASQAARLEAQYAKQIRLALQWLLAQEHQRFFLLQQNEASDWADIMPRSGFVLYTNALWYHVKRLYRVPHATRDARELQRAVPSVLRRHRRISARAIAQRIRAAHGAQSRPLSELRELLVLRR